MSTRQGWLNRLLSWAVGAVSVARPQRAQPDDTAFLIPVHEQALDERDRFDRRDHEREMELRALMSNWM